MCKINLINGLGVLSLQPLNDNMGNKNKQKIYYFSS